ncbi:MAG: helix-turn-helix domain-containing protein [Nitrospirae bacterium]|nr:helix-turn-helix domain-containing protein [Nitrospirota bacterium]
MDDRSKRRRRHPPRTVTVKPTELGLRLGARIRALRERGGVTQVQLAERASIGIETVSRLERGIENPTIGILETVCRALNVDIHELFERAYSVEEYIRKQEVRQIAERLGGATPAELAAFRTLANGIRTRGSKPYRQRRSR